MSSKTLPKTIPSTLRNITNMKVTNKIPSLQPCVHSGWMWKKGAINQLANHRWFEIRGDQLYYFKGKDEENILGQISLAGNAIKRHNSLADTSSGKYVFELVAGKERLDRPVYEKHDSLIFGTATPYELEEWIKAINRIIYTPNGGGMFGRSLHETIKIDSRRGGGMVPIIVEKCIEYLKKNALSEEGVFRVPGLKDDVELLKTAFNKGEIIDFEVTTYKVNIVASVLKQYIGDLPQSVIPPDYYEAFIAVGRDFGQDKDVAVSKFTYLLKNIHIDNSNLLKYICRFLHHLVKYEDVTKMSLTNLALVFGPNILRPQNEDPALLLKSLNDVNATTMALITYQEDLFPVLDNETWYKPIDKPKIEISIEQSEMPEDPQQSPSEMFLDRHNTAPATELRRSRSVGNLYEFVPGLETVSFCSGQDYYDWTTHLKEELTQQKKAFLARISELEGKLDAEMKIREMLKIRLADENKARTSAEERLELYRVGIEEYCKTFGHANICIP